MKGAPLMIVFCGLMGGLSPASSAAGDNHLAAFGVEKSSRAEFNWMMNCQGCHGVKGEGSVGGAPPMPGVVAKFLSIKGGREYLARVPGVANAPLSDEELSDVLNWMLHRFACDPLPADFTAYEPQEMAVFRSDVLITDAHTVRAELLSAISAPSSSVAQPEANREATSCAQ